MRMPYRGTENYAARTVLVIAPRQSG
jgi:hypothetical protein